MIGMSLDDYEHQKTHKPLSTLQLDYGEGEALENSLQRIYYEKVLLLSKEPDTVFD